VRSQAAGERVLASITAFLEGKLRLRVNRQKSAAAPGSERKFLGYRLCGDGTLTIATTSIQRAKERIRQITRRNRGVSFERVIGELNSFTTGWVTYFRYAKAKGILAEMDSWLRRKLRCVRLKQRKRAASIAIFLQQLGVPKNQSWTTAACGKGWWRMAKTPAASQAMSNQWFRECGLVSLLDRYARLQH
jgi:RNA-directed DNA polymerase